MRTIISREITLMIRSPGSWLLGIIFFALFLMLCAIALGGEFSRIRPLAPALIWLAIMFSQLLGFNGLFQADHMDGTLEQLTLSGISPLIIVASKAVAYFICAFLPLLIAVPLAGLAFDLSVQTIAAICLSLLCAAPAIIAYGIMASAILAGRQGGGFLSVLITTPFMIPLLIFGVAAVDSYPVHGLTGMEFQAIFGLSFIGCAVGLPAASTAIAANME